MVVAPIEGVLVDEREERRGRTEDSGIDASVVRLVRDIRLGPGGRRLCSGRDIDAVTDDELQWV